MSLSIVKYVNPVEERSFRTVSHGLKISRERSTGTPDMPDMCTHVRQIRGWMMDVLVDLSFHVRALIRALVLNLILLRIALRLHFLVLKPVAR